MTANILKLILSFIIAVNVSIPTRFAQFISLETQTAMGHTDATEPVPHNDCEDDGQGPSFSVELFSIHQKLKLLFHSLQDSFLEGKLLLSSPHLSSPFIPPDFL